MARATKTMASTATVILAAGGHAARLLMLLTNPGATVVSVVRTGVGFFSVAEPMAPTPMKPRSTHTEICAGFGQERNFTHRRFAPVGVMGAGVGVVIPDYSAGACRDLMSR